MDDQDAPLLLLPVISTILRFLPSVLGFACTCRAAKMVVKNMAQEDGLRHVWREMERMDNVYCSGVVGDGTVWDPYRVDQDLLVRQPSPVIQRTVHLRPVLNQLRVQLCPHSKSSRDGWQTWVHHTIDFCLSAPVEGIGDFRGRLFLEPQHVPHDILLHAMVLEHDKGQGPWVGHVSYGTTRRIVLAKRHTPTTIEILPGEVGTVVSRIIQPLTFRQSEFGRLLDKQARSDMSPLSGAEAFPADPVFPTVGIVLYELMKQPTT